MEDVKNDAPGMITDVRYQELCERLHSLEAGMKMRDDFIETCNDIMVEFRRRIVSLERAGHG